jgi:hypothetical protein
MQVYSIILTAELKKFSIRAEGGGARAAGRVHRVGAEPYYR